jgi:hypothetical protein
MQGWLPCCTESLSRCRDRAPSVICDMSDIRNYGQEIEQLLDELWDKFRMMGEIGVHENNKVARAKLKTVNVSCPVSS